MVRRWRLVDFDSHAKWASSWIGGALLIGLCAAAYLPGLHAVPPLDGDEARYADAAREMCAAHNWRAVIVPHIEGAPRLNKPPLVYWLEAGSAYVVSGGAPEAMSYPDATKRERRGQRELTGSPPTRTHVFTGGIGAYRLPSVVATILAVLIIWRLGCQMFAPPCALLAAALWAGCFLVVVDARLARTDQVLALFTCAAQWALWNLWRRDDAGFCWRLLLWSAIGLGMMTKGPVTPGVVGLTVLAICVVTRNWSWLRRLHWVSGLFILAIICVPWVALALQFIGGRTFWQVTWHELVLRGVSASGGRAGPAGYHLVLLSGLFWPGGLLVIPAAILAFRRGLRWGGARASKVDGSRADTKFCGLLIPQMGRSAEFFCLAWIIPSWIVCELIETKLPHYPLPLYPAIALLCARAAWSAASGKLPLMHSRLSFFGDAVWVLLGAGLLLGLPGYLALRGSLRSEPGVLLAVLAASVLLILLLIAAWVLARRKYYIAGLSVALCASLAGGRLLFQTVMPNLRSPWITSTLVSELARINPTGERPIAAAGFFRESLAFLTGGRVTFLPHEHLEAWLDKNPQGIAMTPEPVGDTARPIHILTTVTGFDYIEGVSRTIAVFDRSDPALTPSKHVGIQPKREPDT